MASSACLLDFKTCTVLKINPHNIFIQLQDAFIDNTFKYTWFILNFLVIMKRTRSFMNQLSFIQLSGLWHDFGASINRG